ncbi:hypothetical protein EV182_001536, partial [Spiromyces aspiralis]
MRLITTYGKRGRSRIVPGSRFGAPNDRVRDVIFGKPSSATRQKLADSETRDSDSDSISLSSSSDDEFAPLVSSKATTVSATEDVSDSIATSPTTTEGASIQAMASTSRLLQRGEIVKDRPSTLAAAVPVVAERDFDTKVSGKFEAEGVQYGVPGGKKGLEDSSPRALKTNGIRVILPQLPGVSEDSCPTNDLRCPAKPLRAAVAESTESEIQPATASPQRLAVIDIAANDDPPSPGFVCTTQDLVRSSAQTPPRRSRRARPSHIVFSPFPLHQRPKDAEPTGSSPKPTPQDPHSQHQGRLECSSAMEDAASVLLQKFDSLAIGNNKVSRGNGQDRKHDLGGDPMNHSKQPPGEEDPTYKDEDIQEPNVETFLPRLPARQNVQQSHILAACGQSEPINWETGGLEAIGIKAPSQHHYSGSPPAIGIRAQAPISEQGDPGFGISKIGEATYSEVFSGHFDLRKIPAFERTVRINPKNLSGDSAKEDPLVIPVAIKVLPFGNHSLRSSSGEKQTTLRDLYQEIGATLALSRLADRERIMVDLVRRHEGLKRNPWHTILGTNFVKVYRVCICKGRLPAPLLRAWDRWNREYPELCENRRPDFYPSDQLFAVFILEIAGETLETAEIRSWKEAQSIIRQLIISLAVAEQMCEFEHRDLHWGNILITRCDPTTSLLYRAPTSNKSTSTILLIPSYGIRCTIIDYTLSRLHVADSDGSMTVKELVLQDSAGGSGAKGPKDNVFYVNLRDESLFTGEGDI